MYDGSSELSGSETALHLQNRTVPSEQDVASRYGARPAGCRDEELKCPARQIICQNINTEHHAALYDHKCSLPSPAAGVTRMTSTPCGRSSSWLNTFVLVRVRRQALWRLDVLSFDLWACGEPAVSKLNCEQFVGDGDAISLFAGV